MQGLIPQSIGLQLDRMHSSIGIEYHDGHPRGYVKDNHTGDRWYETPIKDENGKVVMYNSEEDCLQKTIDGALKIGAPKTMAERAAETGELNRKLDSAKKAIKGKDDQIGKLQAELDALKAHKSEGDGRGTDDKKTDGDKSKT